MTALLHRPEVSNDFEVPLFPDDVLGRLIANRRERARLDAEAVALVGDLAATDACEDFGYRSLTSLLIDRLRCSPTEARGLIRMATVLEEMPHTRRALASGDIDLNRARRLATAREANPDLFAEHEQALVDTVTGLTTTDARKALAYWEQQAALEAVERDASTVRDRRRLHVSQVGDMVHIDGRLDPVSGQIVITALDALVDPGSLDPNDTRSAPQRRADALTQLAQHALDTAELPTNRRNRPHLLIHGSLEALEARAGQPCELEDGTVITPETLRRLACDARITRIITGPDSEVLDVGRTTRTIPRGIWNALVGRDRHCVIPGCRAPTRWTDAHHVIHWADGGPTALDNLALLCTRHHTLLHEGKITLPAEITQRAHAHHERTRRRPTRV